MDTGELGLCQKDTNGRSSYEEVVPLHGDCKGQHVASTFLILPTSLFNGNKEQGMEEPSQARASSIFHLIILDGK